MDTRVATSFIPKKPLQEARPSASRFAGVFVAGSILMLVISIVLSVGVFLYKGYLAQNIAGQSATLSRAQAAFEPNLIRDLIRLDTRINESKRLLAGHVAISPFFELLGGTTLQNIAFQNLNFSVAGGKATVSMKGQARSFSDIALQSDVFAKTKQIRDPIFADLNLDQTGNVVFSLSATLDPSLILYRNNLPTQQMQFSPQNL